MDIKHRLQNFTNQNQEIEQIQERILSLRERMYSIRSTSDISEVPGGSGNSDKIGDVVATITDLEDTYHCLLRTLIAEQKAIEEIIATLEPIERLLIRARYIENQPWESVCGIIGYSWAQTHRVHANILNKLSE